MAAALGAAVLAAIGVNTVRGDQLPEQPAINGPKKVYVAKPGDTEWSIGSRAYPDIDPRMAQDLIDQQNPNEDHLVIPGQEFVFATDAEIGKLNEAPGEHPSAQTG